jgi:hypothetical protein
MIFDKNHNEVKIGSWVKVLFIEPGFISTFPLNEAKIVKAMINKTFKVIEIAHSKALVKQQFSARKGISLALAPEEMELVKTEDPGKVNIAHLPTIH